MNLVRRILEAVVEKEFTPRGEVTEPDTSGMMPLKQAWGMMKAHGWGMYDKFPQDFKDDHGNTFDEYFWNGPTDWDIAYMIVPVKTVWVGGKEFDHVETKFVSKVAFAKRDPADMDKIEDGPVATDLAGLEAALTAIGKGPVKEKEFTPRGDVLEPSDDVPIGAVFKMLNEHGWKQGVTEPETYGGKMFNTWEWTYPGTTIQLWVHEPVVEDKVSGEPTPTGKATLVAVNEGKGGWETLPLDPELAGRRLDEIVGTADAPGDEKYPLQEPGIANTAAGHTLWDFGPGYKVTGNIEDHGLDIWGPDTGAIANTAEEAKKIFGWLRANYQGHISVFDVYDDEEPLLVELNNAGLVDVWYPIGESPDDVVAKFEGEKG